MTKPIVAKSNAVQLTPNFYLSELIASETATRRGINNTPDPFQTQNLFTLAALLEQVRKALGNKPIIVSSGFRSVALNAAVGGSKSSDHLRGLAADFTCPGFGTPLEICHKLVAAGIEFGQLIQEGTWVHISVGTKRQVLTAHFSGGKASYSTGL